MKQLDAPWMKALLWALALVLPGGLVLLSALLILQRRILQRHARSSEEMALVSSTGPATQTQSVPA